MQVFGMPSYYFNPRSYKRSDSRTSSKYDRSDFISIHAPTRGATTSFAATICKLRLFQSTLLQEERLGADIMFLCSDNISIHAPTRGATSLWMLQRNSGSISIHAPTRGATLFTMPFRHGPCISIHAPTRGATVVARCAVFPTRISIHAPTRGATMSFP